MSHTRKTTLAFILLELSPILLFEIDFVSTLNSKMLRNILMVLDRNVEQEETTCHIQE